MGGLDGATLTFWTWRALSSGRPLCTYDPLALEHHVGLVLLYHPWGPTDQYYPWGLGHPCHLWGLVHMCHP